MNEAWKAWGQRAQAALQSKFNFHECVELLESAKTLQDCRRAHHRVLDTFLHKSECGLPLRNLLIKMYVRCGSVEDARSAFDKMAVRDVHSWNLMLTAYARNGYQEGANILFDAMPEWDIISLNLNLSCMQMQMDQRASAKLFFDSMPEHDLFSWNTLLAAYDRIGHIEQVKQLFENMPERDLATWNIFMGSCIHKSIAKMKQIFESLPETNLIAWNAMLAACARYGHFSAAEQYYEQMPCWDMVSFGTLLSCYLKHGEAEKAKLLFDSMEFHDMVSLNTNLLLYSSRLEDAKVLFHAMQERDQVSWTTMLSIYIQNGEFEDAVKFFDRIPDRDVVSMTSVLTALAQTGNCEGCFEIFSLMQAEGLRPDQTCFTCLLLACMHSGNSELGWRYFRSQLMDFENTRKPSKQQYACMIDLLGRSGYLQDAQELLASMPYIADGYEWTSVLSSCRSETGGHSGGFPLPKWLLEDNNSSPYILLYNIQAEPLGGSSKFQCV